MSSSKQCSACAQTFSLDGFHLNKKGKFGRTSKCKACTSANYYAPKKEQYLAAVKARRSSAAGREREREWANTRRRRDPLTRIVQEAKVRAVKRGLEFNITAADLFVPDSCPVLGIPIGMAYGSRSDSSLSIDRVEGSKGYVAGNVRIISWRANRLKSDATLEEVEAIALYMRSASSPCTAKEGSV